MRAHPPHSRRREKAVILPSPRRSCRLAIRRDCPHRRPRTTPRALRPPAQGCAARATLGARPKRILNPEGVASTAPFAAEFWQVGRMAMENNVIELVEIEEGLSPVGFTLGSVLENPPPDLYGYRQVLIRNNVIRTTGNSPPRITDPVAASSGSWQNIIIEGNTIDLASLAPFRNSSNRPVKYLNNRTPSGGIPQESVNFGVTGRLPDELADRIQDALVLALI